MKIWTACILFVALFMPSLASAGSFSTVPVSPVWIGNSFPADFQYSFTYKKTNWQGKGVEYSNIENELFDFIAKREGFYSCAYTDPAGYPTIGYGHKINSGETFGCITKSQAKTLFFQDVGYTIASYSKGWGIDIGSFINYSMSISRSDQKYYYPVNRKIPTSHNLTNSLIALNKIKGFNKQQTVALLSFLYNLGPKIIEQNWNGKLGTAFKNGDYRGIATAMRLYDKAYTPSGKKIALPGLTKRRNEEARLFLSNPRICWITRNVLAASIQYKTCYRY